MISPRLVKGGIVQVSPENGSVLRVIALQYNPDSVRRTVAAKRSGEGSGERDQATRLRGVAVETISLEAELDATDALAESPPEATAASVGLHPQLAALELLAQPSADTLQRNHALAAAGVLEILPEQAPLALFVWSAQRVVPVAVTELSITEEAFDVHLNPTRARVGLTMRVLSVDDLGFAHRGGSLHMAHLRGKEGLAGRAGSAALSLLGVEGV